MKRVRMFALIWLAMAAAMLPAGARPANASFAHLNDQQGPTHQDTDRSGNSEKVLAAAPVCDVWDGHAARMVTGRPETGRSRACPESQNPAHMSLVPFVAEFGEPACIGCIGFAAPVDSRAPDSGRVWLVCRFAHAPPSRH